MYAFFLSLYINFVKVVQAYRYFKNENLYFSYRLLFTMITSKMISSTNILFLVLSSFIFLYPLTIGEEQPQENPEPGFDETSEYMMGNVAVLVVFVNDLRSTWKSDEVSRAMEDVSYALIFWENEAKKNNIPLKFSIVSTSAYTEYIPAQMSKKDHYIWVSDVLGGLGYKGTDSIHTARLLANDLRKDSHSDWSFIIFMVKDTNWYNFNNEVAGFALLGGPYAVISWKPAETGLPIPLIKGLDILKLNEAVIAHEVGHIFYATDEYDDVLQKSGYFASYEKEDSNCIMDSPVELSIEDLLLFLKRIFSIWCISEGTKRQIGWVDDNLNDIPDLLEIKMEVSLHGYKPFTDDDALDFIGRIVVRPLSNRNPHGSGRDVTIVKIERVSATVSLRDNKVDLLMGTIDGRQPNSPVEDIHFVIPFLGVGEHNIKIKIKNNFDLYELTLGLSSIHTFIVIDKFLSLPERVDVGTQQKIGFHAVWAHNNEPLTIGTILINGIEAQPEGNGWFYILDSSQFVGEKVYTVTGSNVVVITESRNERFEEKIEKVEMRASSLKVIYDKVSINLLAEDERVDIGSMPNIHYEAYYEYDKSPFIGKVLLGPELSSLDYVGSKTFRVAQIIDEKYGLTVFSSNEVTVIFDKIIAMLSPDIQRVQVGRSAEVSLRVYYAYDGELFTGKIIVDGAPLNYRQGYINIGVSPEYQIAKKIVRVNHVIDEKYGLTNFESNMVEIVFDKINLEWSIEPELFAARINVRLRYQSDNSPIIDANVMVNGVSLNNLGDGNYETKIIMLGTTENFKLRIDKYNFDEIFAEKSQHNNINLAFQGTVIPTLLLTVIIVSIFMIRRRQARTKYHSLPIKEPPSITIDKTPIVTKIEEIEVRIKELINLLGKIDDLKAKNIISESDYLIMKSKIEDKLRSHKNILREYIINLEKQINQKEEVLRDMSQKYDLKTIDKLVDEIIQLNEKLTKFKKLLEGS